MERDNLYNFKIDLVNHYVDMLNGNEFLIVIGEKEHLIKLLGLPSKGSVILNIPSGNYHLRIQSTKKGVFQKDTIQELDFEMKADQNIWLNYNINIANQSNLKLEYQKEPFIVPVELEKDSRDRAKEFAEKDNKSAWGIGKALGKTVWLLKKTFTGK